MTLSVAAGSYAQVYAEAYGIAYTPRSEADAQAITVFTGEIDMTPVEDELVVFEEAFLEQNER